MNDRRKTAILGIVGVVALVSVLLAIVLIDVFKTTPQSQATTCTALKGEDVTLVVRPLPKYLPELDYSPIPQPPAHSIATNIYRVRSGDCLFAIAYRFAVPGGWQAIYRLNRARIGSNPNLIRIGQLLTLPPGSRGVPRPPVPYPPAPIRNCPLPYGTVPYNVVPLCDNISWWKQHAHYELDYIVSHESSWNPYAVNPSSGTYGLGQFMPGNYFAPPPGAPVHIQIQQIIRYVNSRYGGLHNAYIFWINNHWY